MPEIGNVQVLRAPFNTTSVCPAQGTSYRTRVRFRKETNFAELLWPAHNELLQNAGMRYGGCSGRCSIMARYSHGHAPDANLLLQSIVFLPFHFSDKNTGTTFFFISSKGYMSQSNLQSVKYKRTQKRRADMPIENKSSL